MTEPLQMLLDRPDSLLVVYVPDMLETELPSGQPGNGMVNAGLIMERGLPQRFLLPTYLIGI